MDWNQRLKLAVALKYKYNEDPAPYVLASGRGNLAEALVKKARESGVPVQEDKNLAQILSDVRIGQTIPEELFEVVAQIMAMIFKMDHSLPKC